jgi:phenylalanine-4-hydroxylase
MVWDEAFQLWGKRNKEMYETEDDNNSTLLFDLKQQIRELYNLEDKVRNNFALPLNERLTQHPIQLHNYIQIQGPIIRQSVKEAEKLAAARTRQLPTFFPPG